MCCFIILADNLELITIIELKYKTFHYNGKDCDQVTYVAPRLSMVILDG